jgi:DNA-binding NtrC family response regulator
MSDQLRPARQIKESNPSKSARVETRPRILVVDDEPTIRTQLERVLTAEGFDVAIASSAEEGLERLAGEDIDLLITDIRLPGLSGVELTQRVKHLWPTLPVIVITGFGEVGTAVQVLKLGASDHVIKPFGKAAILDCVRTVLEKSHAHTELRHLRRFLMDEYEFVGMVSKTPEMHRVFEIIHMVSNWDTTVVVEGETGTGKEMVASAIHHQSQRSEGPFVPINCAVVPENLLESELFGYERGAFTGAHHSRPGKIELAQGGTLFLDEIESISLAMQAKLLRVLEDRKIERLGGSRRIDVDMRVVAASNVPLQELVAQGQMRSDFYYRINVVPIRLIPLRKRKEDIPLLVQAFLSRHQAAVKKGIGGVSDRAMDQLMQYSWPGNIRELQNVLERTILQTDGRIIEKVDLLESAPAAPVTEKDASLDVNLRDWLRQQERNYLIQQLAACGGKIGPTARRSGVDLKTVYRKMVAYGLDKRNFTKKGSSVSATGEEAQEKHDRKSPPLSLY